MKRNSVIELKLINVNPFAVDVKTDIQEESAISLRVPAGSNQTGCLFKEGNPDRTLVQ